MPAPAFTIFGHGDYLALARVLHPLRPGLARALAASRILDEAAEAHAYAREHGHQHPKLGDGSLMAAALAGGKAVREPGLTDPAWLATLSETYALLAEYHEQAAEKRRAA